ncbi:MAG: hypothetical protein ACRECE_09810 [Xanthobacteraceae bacterium]
MKARRAHVTRQWALTWRWEEIAFLVLGGTYSLTFWAWQSGQLWRALRQLL